MTVVIALYTGNGVLPGLKVIQESAICCERRLHAARLLCRAFPTPDPSQCPWFSTFCIFLVYKRHQLLALHGIFFLALTMSQLRTFADLIRIPDGPVIYTSPRRCVLDIIVLRHMLAYDRNCDALVHGEYQRSWKTTDSSPAFWMSMMYNDARIRRRRIAGERLTPPQQCC
jgi:hypothetical protein